MDGILFSSIENGGVLFADKKRTASVLRPMGIYAPMELLRNGYVGSITYRGRKVNIDGVPFSTKTSLMVRGSPSARPDGEMPPDVLNYESGGCIAWMQPLLFLRVFSRR